MPMLMMLCSSFSDSNTRGVTKRATDLTWQEEDLAFREEMWARRNKLLDELELEAEEKGKCLEGKE
jgi:hypothetical protein